MSWREGFKAQGPRQGTGWWSRVRLELALPGNLPFLFSQCLGKLETWLSFKSSGTSRELLSLHFPVYKIWIIIAASLTYEKDKIKYVKCSAPSLLQNKARSSVHASEFLCYFQELGDAVQTVLWGLFSEDAALPTHPQDSRLILLQEPNGSEDRVSGPSCFSLLPLWALWTRSDWVVGRT